jgi:hypothetical protein
MMGQHQMIVNTGILVHLIKVADLDRIGDGLMRVDLPGWAGQASAPGGGCEAEFQ